MKFKTRVSFDSDCAIGVGELEQSLEIRQLFYCNWIAKSDNSALELNSEGTAISMIKDALRERHHVFPNGNRLLVSADISQRYVVDFNPLSGMSNDMPAKAAYQTRIWRALVRCLRNVRECPDGLKCTPKIGENSNDLETTGRRLRA